MEEAQPLCARCASLGRTCCQNSQIFITSGDIRRITRETGLADGFAEYAVPADPGYLANTETDPVWSRIFGRDGSRRILSRQPGGDCVFLSPAGCRLAMEVRPLICRLYPYDYNDAAIKGVNGHQCPPPERDAPALLLALLSMNRDQAEAWRQTLYREIREEFPD